MSFIQLASAQMCKLSILTTVLNNEHNEKQDGDRQGAKAILQCFYEENTNVLAKYSDFLSLSQYVIAI